VPWASDRCDADIALALAEHAPPPKHSGPEAEPLGSMTRARLLDIGCGLGQVARHAAERGYRVVATDIAETGLTIARDRSTRAIEPDGSTRAGEGDRSGRAADIVWLRDDILASGLVGPFDVIVDRATLHVLAREHAAVWAATITRITSIGSIVIVKCHRDGIPDVTTGWSGAALVGLLPSFDLIDERASELPGITSDTPVPAVLAILKRVRA
jgi:SAM-dependent methyltransferase